MSTSAPSKKSDGGSAFPKRFTGEIKQYAGVQSVTLEADEAGMTLRDYFAAKAMRLMSDDLAKLYSSGWLSGGNSPEGYLASIAYAMADAMLAERAK